jgi:hypothetical protein
VPVPLPGIKWNKPNVAASYLAADVLLSSSVLPPKLQIAADAPSERTLSISARISSSLL